MNRRQEAMMWVGILIVLFGYFFIGWSSTR
jgi:hypothetical protein